MFGSVLSMDIIFNEYSDNEVMEEDLLDIDIDDEWEGLEIIVVWLLFFLLLWGKIFFGLFGG